MVETDAVGEGTRIWAFAHILPGARVGADCNICDHTFIENDVVIGDRVTIKSGVQLWDGVTLEDDVFVGPNATFTNDPFPRSRQYQKTLPRTLVRCHASIGANATILPGLTIDERAMVGAGAVVTKCVPPDTIVTGNPAQIVGYVGTGGKAVDVTTPLAEETEAGSRPSRVAGVSIHRLPLVPDLRGSLTFGEARRHVPFEIKRYFLVFDVPGMHIRGEHAHRGLQQFLICVHGTCHAVVDDGTTREEYVLNHPSVGLYVPPMCWCVQYKYSPNAVLLVLASSHYDDSDYIRDYSEFLKLVNPHHSL
ncbi:MAG: WxcM-like domain-containing protein [Acidobacteriia bacterium]|nr:WxcM-like domain-containing protein [Terriglobia bacterium]